MYVGGEDYSEAAGVADRAGEFGVPDPSGGEALAGGARSGWKGRRTACRLGRRGLSWLVKAALYLEFCAYS